MTGDYPVEAHRVCSSSGNRVAHVLGWLAALLVAWPATAQTPDPLRTILPLRGALYAAVEARARPYFLSPLTAFSSSIL